MKKIIFACCLIATTSSLFAQVDSLQILNEIFQKRIDSIENALSYEHGSIDLMNGVATIHIPSGYKFLNSEQSEYVLSEIWGNPPSESLGMLFPEDVSPISDNFTFAVEVTYSNDGYIEDSDAEDIDYDELLESMQNDTELANKDREELGYENIELIGWASEPFYDKQNKKLHWAKELKFGSYEVNTLNYNIRVLGREGYLNLNAIGDMDVLPQIQTDIDYILNSVEFNEGYAYNDFDSSVDKVAAYGIGGLIAGKMLAKAGMFAGLLKFWKVIVIGAVGLFGAFKKRIFGGK